MKRAPVIRKTTVPATPVETEQAPAAPMVDSLIARVGAMARGNSILIPVCGRDVKFTLETVPGNVVESTTRVWAGNERDQDLLTEESLDDLIPSFLLTGQQNPAFGRRVEEGIEVADGSRRRKTAILTASDYRILVGDLDDEQMDALCKLGNDYRPTSAYERGKRYATRLCSEFGGNISSLAAAENISRKIITRCINTAKLPKELIALFSHPGELSARAGDALQKSFSEKEDLLREQIHQLAERKTAGVIFEADEVIQALNNSLKAEPVRRTAPSTRQEIVKGATAIYKGNKVVFQLDRSLLPEHVVEQIETLLSTLK
ncbi:MULTISPECIES: ParB/RepB/Spo0J family plasmid partition protein [Enterobacteriaceae]|uniref:ParB/RepB/Spo0J family plasmid partition protein n=1 Tax=Enterobacteriaceae TaxID=543 RepID=UPI000C9AC1DB|nr:MULTISPECIES: ParB/RepB/Spo0J family plasmid partition protein [Enterobacteriaceae]HCM9383522.1 ParB/RepB/Spo0J family plasmid partition protein [Enterobacter hormaechei subsp. xiangfangensis]EJK8939083.1 ParB/RepB/Spo0J family plasmid partition protein [Enterobacter hormaechei]EKU3258015.1 ParB/RepB/Spo0J family plasmid partition protein [Enterobacter hormaechei]EKV5720053.1 ParB/RepB/Spo0J family plasmid partition protein [Enterobacter hormaechei]EKV8300255.1 ParB/RepB/Spo0J family plasmi